MAEREPNRAAVNSGRDSERGGESQTVLAGEDIFEGSMRVRGDGTLLGKFEGEIECGGELLVGREADVSANIRARNLTIAGRVQGNIVCTGRLRITATGRLEGDAKAGALVVQEGGVHVGMIKVLPEGVPVEEQRAVPLINRQQSRPPAPPGNSVPAKPAPRAAPGEAGLPPAAHAEGLNGNGSGEEEENGTAKPVDRVRKLWGEFF